ncbi:membrane dipeptidase [Patulibacter sp. SYSU D01012]|uniref:dipeptidase n=1 Tax=Patulibacter sp. SYSU D01012 TaxID=2817381 RepID=UPI001B314CA8
MPSPSLPVLDGHHDALTRRTADRLVDGRPDGHFDLPRARRGGVVASFWAVWCSDVELDLDHDRVEEPGGGWALPLAAELPRGAAAAQATQAAGRLLDLERRGALRVARGVADLDAAAAGGPHAAILHLEGAEPLDPGLEALDLWHAAGLRSLGPVWSRPNAFGDGVAFRFPSSPDTGGGLTDAGRRLVRACNARGILVDLSHLTARGFFDVAAVSDAPLVATHAGAHAVAPGSRNLTDDQLDAIAAADGLVGISFVVDFARRDGRNDVDTPLTSLVAHVRHVADRIGVEHVALGSDFDGGDVPRAVGDVAGVPRLLDALRDDGFDADEVERIAWGNWRRVLGATWR